ncbi:DUF456 domain-containing protein [Thermobifida halotolerans]|uniref:DUF456 domain-containing protein n=1 Tax=Thermobifida halotolerans TaxID=483545 RepID=A0AA97LYK0_9ACTN|nr:DUF456 domain-containing protein [Thermobifida halotolerans]UOE20248.1 DUF456 domain-containing protein [Thermobifida halotolerans]
MTLPVSSPSDPASRTPERPPPWWRRVLGALLLAAASAVMAVAALAAVAAPVDLLRGDGYGMLSPGALAASAVVAILVLLGLWVLCGWTLRRFGVRRASALAGFVLVVPVGYAVARVALFGPVDTLWWASAFAAVSGALVFATAVGLRRFEVAVTAAVSLAVLFGGVAVETRVTQEVLRAEFDRYGAVPVLRHPDWELAVVEPSSDTGEMRLEYHRSGNVEAAPVVIQVYRQGADARWPEEEPKAEEGYQVTEGEKYTLVEHEQYGTSLRLTLDLGTQAQVIQPGDEPGTELITLAGYFGTATDAERAELRGTVGRIGFPG